MPFRLLALASNANHAGELDSHTLALCQASGVDVTVACGPGLEAVGIAELIERSRPHVVVVNDPDAELRRSASIGFTQARERLRGRFPLPAKLYLRAWSPLTPAVTTVVRSASGGAFEMFIREYPAPWVSGVLESDLFAGLREQASELAERLAS